MSHKEFYDRWYATRKPQWDTGASPPELIDFIRTHPPGRALDIGCGTGTNVITLARSGWNATGVDFSENAIEQARKKLQKIDVSAQFNVEDITKVQFQDQSFDLILDWGCYQGLDQGREIYAECVTRWLAPGGWFLLYSLKYQGDMRDFGLQEKDLNLFSSLSLARRMEGFNRGPVTRPCVWLEFTKEIR